MHQIDYFWHHGIVLSDGTTQHLGGGTKVPGVGKPLQTIDALLGLNRLQLSSSSWLNGSAVDVPTEFRYLSLPAETRALINLMNTSVGTGLFNDESRGPAGLRQFDAITEAMNRGADETRREAIGQIRQHEYTVWPINTGGHWETIIIHAERSSAASRDYDRIAQLAVVDPFNHGPTNKLVMQRLAKLLGSWGGMTFAPNCVRHLAIPPQTDKYSCGLRAHGVMTAVMRRVAHLHVSGCRYNEALWQPLDPWFNADEMRLEMAGLCAAMLVRGQGHGARIAVELVDEVRLPVEPGVRNPGALVKAAGLRSSCKRAGHRTVGPCSSPKRRRMM